MSTQGVERPPKDHYLSVRVDERVVRELDHVCKLLDLSRSAVVRICLEMALPTIIKEAEAVEP